MDTVKSLRDLQKMNMNVEEPIRVISTETDNAKATVDQESLNMKCKIKLQEHAKQESAFRSNLTEAHALTCSHMSAMTEACQCVVTPVGIIPAGILGLFWTKCFFNGHA